MPETVVIYIGDGATSEGDMSEAMNLAAVESAAVLFICQNNGWAISKPSHEQMATSIAERANGFGLRSWSIAADDPDDTYLACLAARRYVEAEQAPALIELRATRVRGHTTSDPHRTYRDPNELAVAQTYDPVAAYREKLYAAGVVDEQWLDAVEAQAGVARRQLLEAFAK
jgi:pyruvate dehydrogenase E1 component alpha subunit